MWELLAIPLIAYIVCTSVFWTLGAIMHKPRPKDQTEELTELLTDLAACINSATSEDHATDVLAPCCIGALNRAMEWLNKNDPTWWHSRFSSPSFLDDQETE